MCQKKERFSTRIYFGGNIMTNNQKMIISVRKNKMQKTVRLTDSERSMVEMLGTLAIIGVLSIGGIVGYRYAMMKYRVNKVVNGLNMLSNQLAMTINRLHVSDFRLVLGEPYDNESHFLSDNYAFQYGCGHNSESGEGHVCYKNDTTYYMKLGGISNNACYSLALMIRYLPYITAQQVNGEDDEVGENCNKENDLVLYFDINRNESEDINTNPLVSATTTTAESGSCVSSKDCTVSVLGGVVWECVWSVMAF